MRKSNPVIRYDCFYLSVLGLCFFSPIEKITQNKTKQKCFVLFFFVSFVGELNESQRNQGMQSSFSRQFSSNPPASAS